VEHGHCFSSAFHPIVGQFGLEKMLFALSVGQNFKKNEFANSINLLVHPLKEMQSRNNVPVL
jgi:hypothetical protein